MNSRKALCGILTLLVGTVMVQGASVSISLPFSGSFVGGQVTIVSTPTPDVGATVTELEYKYKIGEFVGGTNVLKYTTDLDGTLFDEFTTEGGFVMTNPAPGTESPVFPFDARSTAASGLPNAADFIDGTCQEFSVMVKATFSNGAKAYSDPQIFSIDNRLPPNPLALDLDATGGSTDTSTPEIIWFNGGERYDVTDDITLEAPNIIAADGAFDDDEDTGLNKGDTIIIVDAATAANNGVYRLSVTDAPDEDELRIDENCTGCSFGENTKIFDEAEKEMTVIRPSSDDLWLYNQAMAFNVAGTITDPDDGFGDFKINDTIQVFGGNNGGDSYRVTMVADGVLTVTPAPAFTETVPALVMCQGADIYGYNIVASTTVPAPLEETRTDSFPPDTLSLSADGTYTVYYRTGDGNSGVNSERNWSAEANQGTIEFTPPVINFGVVDVDNSDEGSEDFSPVTISVSIYDADGDLLIPTDPVRVNYSVSGGTATDPEDFTVGGTGTLLFNGVDTQTFELTIVDDLVNEANETIELLLSGEVNGDLGTRNTFTYTILDNDVNLAITDVTQDEGNAGATDFVFRVSLSSAQSSTVTVNYTTTDGTALSGADYTADTDTLTFAAGVTFQTITIEVTGDDTNEADETFTVDLTNPLPAGAAISDAQGVGTIQNDDALTISIAAAEGSQAENVTPLLFDVRLSAVSGQTVTVLANTADDTALAPGDYTAVVGQLLTFNPGTTHLTVAVTLVDDAINECEEFFTTSLTTPTGSLVTIDAGTGTGTVTDEDDVQIDIAAPANDVEGNNYTFTITLDTASSQSITVDYATNAGTATTADYAHSTGTVTFAPGDTSETVNVAITDDAFNECDEAFTMDLTTPAAPGCVASVTINTATATATILENDGVQIDISGPAAAAEGTRFVFDVTLSAVSEQDISVDWSTADIDAVAGADYTAVVATTITFNAGTTALTVGVDSTDDAINECDEQFQVDLTNPVGAGCANVTINTGTAPATILENDAVQIDISGPAAAAEGTRFVFDVTLSAQSEQDISVDWSTADIDAVAGADYTAVVATTITFNAGTTALTVGVDSTDDAINECDEQFQVDLTTASGAGCANVTINTDTASATINANDPLQMDVAAPADGNEGSRFVFNVTLDVASDQTVTVDYSTSDGTATSAGADYTAEEGSLTFSPGVTGLTVGVDALVDAFNECDEEFNLDLTNIVGAQGCGNVTINTGSDTATILASDPSQLSVTGPAASAVEGTRIVFTVTLDTDSEQTVTVDYATSQNTALSGADYTHTTGTLTFSAGVTGTTVGVPTTDDGVNECDEEFNLVLTTPTGCGITIGTATDNATLTDNDDLAISVVGDAPKVEGSRFVFTLTMAPASEQDVAVDWQTLDGSATSGGDYTGSGGPQAVTFAAGTTSMTVGVETTDDAINECNETFSVELTNANPASCAAVVTLGAAAQVTVQDTPDIVQITLAGPAPVTEGSDSVFTVTLDIASEQTITVDYSTTDGTAGAADYTPAAGVTLTFSPGVTARTIAIATADDAVNEAAETFDLDLTTPTGVSCGNAAIAVGNATATIDDNDALTISIDDVGEDEGDAGTVPFVFTVTLSAVSEQVITVDYDTVDGTAISGADYVHTGGTLTFDAGTTAQTLTVQVNGDLDCENDEIFTVELTTPTGDGVTIADGSGTGTINDDEVFLGLDQVTGRENNWVYVTVELAVCEDLQALIFSIAYESNDLTYVEGSEMVLDDGSGRVDAAQVIVDSDADGKLVVVVQGVEGDTNIDGGNGNILALCFRIRPGMTIGLASDLTLGDVNATGTNGEEIVLDTQDGDITAVTTQFKVDGDESGDPTAPTTGAVGGRAINNSDPLYLYRAVKYGAFDFVPVIPQSVRDASKAEFTSDREIVSFVRSLGDALDVDGDLSVEAEQDLVYLYRFIANGGSISLTVPTAHAADELTVEAAIQLNLGLADPPVDSVVGDDVIDPIVDSAATTEPADGTNDPLVVYFSESLRDDGSTNLIAGNGPAGFITSSRGVVDVDFSSTVSEDGRSVSVAPIGGNWSTGETVTVDMDTVDDAEGNQGSDNDTGDADNTHTFTIP